MLLLLTINHDIAQSEAIFSGYFLIISSHTPFPFRIENKQKEIWVEKMFKISQLSQNAITLMASKTVRLNIMSRENM